MRKNGVKIYTSKENVKNNYNKLKKNLNFYKYDFIRELVQLKYNIENNIIDLIKS